MSSGTRKTVTMLNSTGKEKDVVGSKIPAASYFGYTSGIHTVQFDYQNFSGSIGIQGTLSLEPDDTDWFWIELPGITDFENVPYLLYPKDPQHPTGASSTFTGYVGDTGTEAVSFKGNFTFLRAVIGRDNIVPFPEQPSDGSWPFGQVDRILLCL